MRVPVPRSASRDLTVSAGQRSLPAGHVRTALGWNQRHEPQPGWAGEKFRSGGRRTVFQHSLERQLPSGAQALSIVLGLDDLLEGHFERLLLLNPQHVNGLTGRKTDTLDAEWLA